jgi:hypothetical protein
MPLTEKTFDPPCDLPSSPVSGYDGLLNIAYLFAYNRTASLISVVFMIQQQLYLEMGGDFVLNGNGGLALAAGWDVIRQNFERFVFTNPARTDRFGNPIPADWLFHPTFGLGANAMLGQTFDVAFINQLQQKVYQGALSASTGNATVPPVVTVAQGNVPNQLNVTTVITPAGGQAQTLVTTLP